MEAKAVYDFEKTNADELSFKQNEMLLVTTYYYVRFEGFSLMERMINHK